MKTARSKAEKKAAGRGPAADEAGVGGQPALWREAVYPLAIFTVALAVRLLYLFQIETIPLFYFLAGDGRVYDEWAQRIAAGDWLGKEVFYQAPLYPYFLGLLQWMLGHDVWTVRVVQAVLGAISCSLLYWVGRSFFTASVGIAGGFILSLYGPAVFYGGLIQKTVLDLALLTVLLFLLGRVQSRSSWLGWALVGITLALLCLTRENALIWLLVLPLWIWLDFARHSPRIRLAWIGLLLLGAALVLFPVGLRNFMVGGDFTLTTAQLGPNLFIGNNPDADGTYAPLRGGHGDARFERRDATELAEQALGRSLSPNQVSRYWLARSLEYIFSQPLDWLRLMGKKWLLVWNVFEVEDADDFYLYQKWSSVLGVLGRVNNFGLVAPLAAVGCLLTLKRWRRLWLLYVLLGSFAASVALIYVFGRYRFPLVPILALFAGAAVVEAFALYRERRVREGIACALVGLATLVIVHRPLIGKPGPSAAGYNNLGNALARQERTDEAIESYRQALALEPTSVAAHYNLANLLAKQGNLKAASAHYEEAVRLSPDFPEAYRNLGNLLMQQGDLEKAIELLRKAVAISPRQAEGHFYLGTALAKQGQLTEAIDHLQKAIGIKPDHAEAYHNLGRVLGAQGRLDKAVEAFQSALNVNPKFAEAHESLALAFSQMGEKDKARKHYEEAVRLMKSQKEVRGAR
ncbi:MAG: tetratricopeptide repeat protein [Deltaproteobacteria bacterium]|nr:tetratricopeptide repeat protein [Deltaproteobacteria bacterium]